MTYTQRKGEAVTMGCLLIRDKNEKVISLNTDDPLISRANNLHPSLLPVPPESRSITRLSSSQHSI